MKTTHTFKTVIKEITTNSLDGERPIIANVHWVLEIHEKNDCVHSFLVKVLRIDLVFEHETCTLDLLGYDINIVNEFDMLKDDGFMPREMVIHGRSIHLHY